MVRPDKGQKIMDVGARSVKSIRALERGLDVLQVLRTGSAMGLKDLHAVTGLPKATLLRILKTMKERNLVWQRLADGAYLLSRRFPGSDGATDRVPGLVEVAAPIMAALCETVNWPSVLAVRAGSQMEVIETNRPRSLAPHFPLGPVGASVNMLLSATGRTYFSYCGDDERDEIVALLKASGRVHDRHADDPVWLAGLVARTRAQGYGLRDPSFSDDGRNSIGVPVIVDGQVAAILNLTWARRVASEEHIVGRHLADMRSAAAAMAEQLNVLKTRRTDQ
jgi:IclR family mhp operon transcriptional activator